MKASKAKSHIGILKRICALVLCTAILIGIMPQISFNKAEAANTTQTEALNKLVEWGIMRGDQAGNLSPNRAITRAEFVTMLNRTFGYTKTTSEPFKDVASSNWFYDDIRIAYKAGYFTGTSKTTASPNANLTREAAVVMLCRNIMLKEQSGEDLSFTDSRLASDWSRGFIKAAAEKGIVAGDTSGTFRPLANITRGEVAILLARIIGTPILDTGTYSNNVNGNLMINKSGVTLDNMTISGDLYITGGVGLGYVTLNNVHVYGQIIASGAGESNKGDCSIIIKNSSAPEMIVDSPSNQYVTIRTAGSTVIDKTYVRTDTYLEDKSNEGYGMTYIQVDGEEGTKLDLSGNINEVVSTTPKSAINVGSGVVKKLTIDENATNSTVKIDQGAVVEILNLDVATTVTGKGDIASLYVNAPGCKVEMLPDYIYIRPGITANINGTEMDSTLAEQMSDKPRILTGYPRSDDIAPTQITAKFETNKEGTVYWAVRLSGDGAMVADDIIKPPSYGAKVVKSGKVSAKEANKVIESKVSGLKLDTSYVLSAVLVDERGTNSLVKTLYFTTPDNSKPNFASGYPKASLIEDTYVIFDVAASKNCTLYWAIYKKGMTAPIANDFKDNVLTGSIHSGTVKMTKSEEESVTMGNILENASNALREYTDYDVYFFLSDGVNDSTIKKVSVTTADRTPPEFLTNYPRISKIAAKALTGEAAINENGKIYWAIVKHGTDYPVPDPNLDPNNPSDQEKLQLYYKNQIKGGMYALKSGSVSTTQDAIKSINFSGLAAETAYDIYFVAEDSHGNLSEIKTINNAKTLDSSAPVLLEQKFSLANDKGIPLADTDITLVFDEDIYSNENRKSLYEMFNEIKSANDIVLTTTDKKTFSFQELINRMFVLSDFNADPSNKTLKLDLGGTNFKDYINIKLTEDGYTEVTFKNIALPLKSGGTYWFTLNYITDSSNNNMGQGIKVKEFTILSAQINLNKDVGITEVNGTTVDASFSATSFSNSTANSPDNLYYDFIIASDTNISFNLYYREIGDTDWKFISDSDDKPAEIEIYPTNEWKAISFNEKLGLNVKTYPKLNQFSTKGIEFSIILKSINKNTDPNKWDAEVNMPIFCVSGTSSNLDNFIKDGLTATTWDKHVNQNKTISQISNPTDLTLTINRKNLTAPEFIQGYPRITAGDSIAIIDFKLDRPGDVYCVAALEGRLTPSYEAGWGAYDNPNANQSDPDTPKNDGAEYDITETDDTILSQNLPSGGRNHHINSPIAPDITGGRYSGTGYSSGKYIGYSGSGVEQITLENLEPDKTYYLYFVLTSSAPAPSSVMVYKFTTGNVIPPKLDAYAIGTSQASYDISLSDPKQVSVTAETLWAWYTYSPNMYPAIFDSYVDKTTGQVIRTDLGESKPGDSKYRTVLDLIKSDEFNSITPTSNYKNDFTKLLNDLWGALGRNAESTEGYQASGSWNTTAPENNGSAISTNEKIIDEDIVNKNEVGTKFILFVAAKNITGGTPVFDLVDSLQRVDLSAPRITDIQTNATYNSNRGTLGKGTITILFDKDLYVPLVGSGSTQVIRYDQIADISNIFPNIPGVTGLKAGSKYITIEFDSLSKNTTINIDPSTKDSSKYGNVFCSFGTNTRGQVSIELQTFTDDNGSITCKAVIAGTDGQTSEPVTNN